MTILGVVDEFIEGLSYLEKATLFTIIVTVIISVFIIVRWLFIRREEGNPISDSEEEPDEQWNQIIVNISLRIAIIISSISIFLYFNNLEFGLSIDKGYHFFFDLAVISIVVFVGMFIMIVGYFYIYNPARLLRVRTARLPSWLFWIIGIFAIGANIHTIIKSSNSTEKDHIDRIYYYLDKFFGYEITIPETEFRIYVGFAVLILTTFMAIYMAYGMTFKFSLWDDEIPRIIPYMFTITTGVSIGFGFEILLKNTDFKVLGYSLTFYVILKMIKILGWCAGFYFIKDRGKIQSDWNDQLVKAVDGRKIRNPKKIVRICSAALSTKNPSRKVKMQKLAAKALGQIRRKYLRRLDKQKIMETLIHVIQHSKYSSKDPSIIFDNAVRREAITSLSNLGERNVQIRTRWAVDTLVERIRDPDEKKDIRELAIIRLKLLNSQRAMKLNLEFNLFESAADIELARKKQELEKVLRERAQELVQLALNAEDSSGQGVFLLEKGGLEILYDTLDSEVLDERLKAVILLTDIIEAGRIEPINESGGIYRFVNAMLDRKIAEELAILITMAIEKDNTDETMTELIDSFDPEGDHQVREMLLEIICNGDCEIILLNMLDRSSSTSNTRQLRKVLFVMEEICENSFDEFCDILNPRCISSILNALKNEYNEDIHPRAVRILQKHLEDECDEQLFHQENIRLFVRLLLHKKIEKDLIDILQQIKDADTTGVVAKTLFEEYKEQESQEVRDRIFRIIPMEDNPTMIIEALQTSIFNEEIKEIERHLLLLINMINNDFYTIDEVIDSQGLNSIVQALSLERPLIRERSQEIISIMVQRGYANQVREAEVLLPIMRSLGEPGMHDRSKLILGHIIHREDGDLILRSYREAGNEVLSSSLIEIVQLKGWIDILVMMLKICFEKQDQDRMEQILQILVNLGIESPENLDQMVYADGLSFVMDTLNAVKYDNTYRKNVKLLILKLVQMMIERNVRDEPRDIELESLLPDDILSLEGSQDDTSDLIPDDPQDFLSDDSHELIPDNYNELVSDDLSEIIPDKPDQ